MDLVSATSADLAAPSREPLPHPLRRISGSWRTTNAWADIWEARGFSGPALLAIRQAERKACLSQRDKTMILFALMEPEGGDQHTVFVDGLLMSPGTENYKTPPSPEFADQLRRFLDGQLEISRNA